MLKQEVFSFFQRHLSESKELRPSFSSGKFKKLKQEQISTMKSPFLEAEIKQAVWACEGSKAPGPDGFTFTFLKAHWDIIKGDIIAFVKEFDITGKMPRGCNSTFVMLISKSGDLLTLSDYRPIGLVCCQYKILAKILAQRLKTVLPGIISECQSVLCVVDRFRMEFLLQMRWSIGRLIIRKDYSYSKLTLLRRMTVSTATSWTLSYNRCILGPNGGVG